MKMKQNKGLFIGVAIVVVVVVVIGLVVFGGSRKHQMAPGGMAASSPDTTNAVATNAVSITNYMFGPTAVKVKVGDTVTWTNQDAVHHTVTADTASAAAPNGPLIGKGETYSFKFTKAGTYTYHCMPHPYMHGTVVVTN